MVCANENVDHTKANPEIWGRSPDPNHRRMHTIIIVPVFSLNIPPRQYAEKARPKASHLCSPLFKMSGGNRLWVWVKAKTLSWAMLSSNRDTANVLCHISTRSERISIFSSTIQPILLQRFRVSSRYIYALDGNWLVLWRPAAIPHTCLGPLNYYRHVFSR